MAVTCHAVVQEKQDPPYNGCHTLLIQHAYLVKSHNLVHMTDKSDWCQAAGMSKACQKLMTHQLSTHQGSPLQPGLQLGGHVNNHSADMADSNLIILVPPHRLPAVPSALLYVSVYVQLDKGCISFELIYSNCQDTFQNL